MKRIRAVALLLALCLLLSACGGTQTPLERTAKYLKSAVPEPGFGSLDGDWIVFGLARAGADLSDGYFDRYYTAVEAAVQAADGTLDENRYTEYSRLILALTAIGRDPQNVGGYNLLLPLAIFVWMLAIDWRMGLSILIAPALAMIPMFFLMKNYNSQYAAYMEANNHVNNIIIEYVEGIEVVKAFNQSTSSYEKFVGAVKSFKDFTLNWFKSTWKTMNLMMAIMPTTLLGVLPVGLLLVRGGSITPAELAMGIILSLSIVGPLMKATTFINEAKSMEYAVEAANELLNLPNLPDSGEFVPINHTDIVLQDVSFSYDGTTQNEVLHGISLNMPQGSFTALVGPSGGGKSTVARLIARFWDVTGGSISIGGKNIKELSIHQLSELVSFVTQDNFLFNCSLKENIRLGNPNATDEEVYAAAKAACCDDFIARLEKGYDTPAGDAGKRLSGGEKQRIAIARAILKNAPIVILDEATAFTDPQNEDKIQKSIMALSKGKTLLVIAHRLSTIQNADQIVVLKKGQIVDCGKQGELLERCPLYADMWQAHIGAKNWSVGEKKEVAGNV